MQKLKWKKTLDTYFQIMKIKNKTKQEKSWVR